jgi:hypothetical protein
MKETNMQIGRMRRLLPFGLLPVAALVLAFQMDPANESGQSDKTREQPAEEIREQHFNGNSESFAPTVREVTPAVVRIVTSLSPDSGRENPLWRYLFGQMPQGNSRRSIQCGLGSGVIVSKDGYILTNGHHVNGMMEVEVMALVTPAWRANAAEELRQEAEQAISNLKSSDSTLTNFFEHSAGYVVFPGVRRSGLNLPGKPVSGVVYEKDKPVGEAVLAEPNLKPQYSIAPFHEAIFFERAEALENFKQGRFVMSTDIGAVSAVEGAALTARYRKGVAVFAVPKSGLLESITIGDQHFSYKPLNESPAQITRAQ